MLRTVGVSRSFGGQTVLADVSLAVDGRDRVGIVGPNGMGKSTLLRILAGARAARRGRGRAAPRPRSPSGYLPQEPDARPGETLLGYLARRTGVAGRDRRARPAAPPRWPRTPTSVDGLQRRARPVPGPRRRRPRRPRRRGVRRRSASPAATAARRRPGRATLSGGEAARAALAAILLSPRRRAAARRADQQPRLRRPRPARAVRRRLRAARCVVVSHDRAFLDRVRAPHRRARRAHATAAREFAGGWTRLRRRRATWPARQQYEAHEQATWPSATALRERPAHPARSGASGACGKAKTSGETDKNIRARARSHRSEKQAGEGRRPPSGRSSGSRSVDKPWEGWRLQLQLGAGGAQRRRGGPPRAAPSSSGGDVPARPDRPRGRPGRTGWPSSGPTAAARRPCCGRCSGELPARPRAALARPGRGGRRDGPGARPRSRGDAAAARAFQDATGMALSEARSLLAKFGLGADHVDRAGARPVARRAHPGRCSPRSWPRASTAWCSTSPPTTSTSRPSSSSSRPSPRFEGTLLLVSHDRRFLERVARHPHRRALAWPRSGRLRAPTCGFSRSPAAPASAPVDESEAVADGGARRARSIGHWPDARWRCVDGPRPTVGGPGLALAAPACSLMPVLRAVDQVAVGGDDGREPGGRGLQRPPAGLDGPQPRRRHLLGLHDA